MVVLLDVGHVHQLGLDVLELALVVREDTQQSAQLQPPLLCRKPYPAGRSRGRVKDALTLGSNAMRMTSDLRVCGRSPKSNAPTI